MRKVQKGRQTGGERERERIKPAVRLTGREMADCRVKTYRKGINDTLLGNCLCRLKIIRWVSQA